MAELHSKTIGGVTYHVVALPAGAALRVMTRVLKMAAPSFGDVASLREAASAVGTLLSGVAESLDDGAVEYICAELAKVTHVEVAPGKRQELAAMFDEHFRGRIVELFDWLRFAAEVTYGPLLVALQAKAPEAVAAAPKG